MVSNLRIILCVGVVRDNALHLTKVDEILQLRPSFQNLRRDEYVENTVDDDDDMDKKADNEPKIQQVQMKRKESERAQTTRKQSYGHIQSLEENEAWVTLKHYEIGKKLEISSEIMIFVNQLFLLH